MTDKTLLGVIQRIIADIRALSQRVPPEPLWATVTALDPLRVQPDGATAPIETTPDNLAGPLKVGRRVLIQTIGRRVRVIGPPADVVQHTVEGVNGTWIDVGGVAGEPSIRLRRIFDTLAVQAFMYIPANPTTPEIGIMLRGDGENNSRFVLNSLGQAVVKTYTASPTTSADRPLPFAMAAGFVNITPSAVNANNSFLVTLPSGRFTKTPIINTTPHTGVPGSVQTSFTSPSTGSFLAMLRRTDNTTTTGVHWTAIQLEV